MNSVIKGTGYVLVHVPDMVVHNGTTQTTERIVNPSSEYLTVLPNHLRSYEEAMAYPPNQVYIGNETPDGLAALEQPWAGTKLVGAQRFGDFGEVMPQDEFLLLMQACDAFDLIKLSAEFVQATKQRLMEHPLMNEDILSRVRDGLPEDDIAALLAHGHNEGLYHNGALVGVVLQAHDVDLNLSAHIMLENLVSKASAVLSLLHLVRQSGVAKESIEYVIDCSEEAVGDMNQRGGGNLAKAIAEIAGLVNASGCDVRAFCAAPAHAVVNAASLVKAGTYKNVVVVAGGSTAKLGMNGKDHVKKELPILEDVLGGFAVLIGENDGVNPEIDTGIVGRHKIGTGSSPQAVITALVQEPLANVGMKLSDIDKYAAEMQNPDVTKPAGAGDVPQANYKMIGALAVKNGEIERTALPAFVEQHGMMGWAPTQGHIPSGVPYLGFACRAILEGTIQTAMIIGKGSLFLGRMTNQFDGTSFVVRKNQGGGTTAAAVDATEIRGMIAEALRDFAQSMML